MGVIEQALVESVLRPLAGADPCGPDFSEEPLPPAPGQPASSVRRFWVMSDPIKAFVKTEREGGKMEMVRPTDWPTSTFAGAVRVFGVSKDLRAMVRLVQAAQVSGGLEGLTEGLELMLQLMLRYWDGLHPRRGEDGTYADRLSVLDQIGGALEDWDALRLLPGSATATFGALAGEGAPSVTNELAGAPVGELASLLHRIRTCQRALGVIRLMWRLESPPDGPFFDPDKCRASYPDYSPGPLLARAETAVKTVLEGRGGGGAVVVAADGTTVAASGGGGYVAGQALGSRQEVVSAIDAICNFYKEHEVASPVPFMLRRVQRLVTADFEQLLADLFSNEQLNSFRKSHAGQPPKG
jgi:type VI secretion system protein ImpA